MSNIIEDQMRRKQLIAQAADFPDWDLNLRQVGDLELLINGAFAPLTGYLSQADYESVLTNMRLANGQLWSIPICLDVTSEFAKQLSIGDSIALRDPEGMLVAVLHIEDLWEPDLHREATALLGDYCDSHPTADYLLNRGGKVYLGGRVEGLELPHHYDCRHLRKTPAQLRRQMQKSGWQKVIGFHTDSIMHKAEQQLVFEAGRSIEANLLIQPVVRMPRPSDFSHLTRVRCYEHAAGHLPEATTQLSILPLTQRFAGARETLWHAMIRRNFGCTHFIVNDFHSVHPQHRDNVQPDDSQRFATEHEDELGIKIVPMGRRVFLEERAQYVPLAGLAPEQTPMMMDQAELVRRLRNDLDVPEWFTHPEIVAEMRRFHPPRSKQGFTIFFTGLSGSGKSTIANALMVQLIETESRPVTLLDGDIVRKHLSSELGFSKPHRNINVLRIGFVASEITKNGGIAICAPIAPYATTRREVREMVEPTGGFLEVHVSTSLSVCESRDRKGMYAAARAGKIKEFTGISDPYEAPDSPELAIDTEGCSPEQAAQTIILKLGSMGLITGSASQ